MLVPALCASIVIGLAAQTSSEIHGTVTDPQGLPIGGATVVIVAEGNWIRNHAEHRSRRSIQGVRTARGGNTRSPPHTRASRQVPSPTWTWR